MSQITNRANRCAVVLAVRLLGALVSVALFACGPGVNEVRIEAAPPPAGLAFVFTDSTGKGPSGTIYGLAVVRCGSDSVVWQVAATGSKNAPSRVAYGDTLDGFDVRVPPQPLRPGCYDVFVTDGRRARFRIDGSGHLAMQPIRDSTARR